MRRSPKSPSRTSTGGPAGFFGPYFTGWLRGLTNSFASSLVMLAGFLVVGRSLQLPHEGQAAATQ